MFMEYISLKLYNVLLKVKNLNLIFICLIKIIVFLCTYSIVVIKYKNNNYVLFSKPTLFFYESIVTDTL